jgi:hypothetical protein
MGLAAQTTALAVVLLASLSYPAMTETVQQQQNVLGVPASLLAREGSTLYAGIGDRLATFSLADPIHPAFRGQSPPLGASIRSVAVNATLAAVVLNGGGLKLLDVSDVQRPVLAGSYPTPTTNPSSGAAFFGQLLLVPAGDALAILDVSLPTQPRLVGSFHPPAEVRGVTAAGQYAYVVTTDSSLRVVDLSDPKRPLEVGNTQIEGAGYLSPVAVAHGNAFGTFIFGHYTSSIVIDVSNPARPAQRTNVSTSLYTTAGAFAIQNDLLYAANPGLIGFGSVGAVAIDNPSSPALIASLEAQWNPLLGIAVWGGLAYVLGQDGLLHVLDMANPAAVRGLALVGLGPPPAAPEVPHDDRYFVETGYRIDDEAVWGYFVVRGAVDTFGYPVARTFTFLGCPVQVFQRLIAQHCSGRGVQLLNVLDPDVFPYTRVNFSTFPAADADLKAVTPRPDQPDYASAILEFVLASAPDTWNGLPVQFGSTFSSRISPELAGTDDPASLGLLNLEVWGAPISSPAADPNNPSFVYQRFQRGIMHFDATTEITQGVLLADYLKSVLLGTDLPADLRVEAANSRLFAQYCPSAPGWVCRPDDLPGTDLTFAFVPG